MVRRITFMPILPDPHAATVLMAPIRRRRWPWILALALVTVVLVAWRLAPWWAVRSVQAKTPLPGKDVIIRGASLGGKPPPAMVIGVCNRATVHAIWQGASGRWQPGFILGDGQHAWGTFTQAPDITWRLDIDDSVTEPRIEARLPGPLVERLLDQHLGAERSPVSSVRFTAATLNGTPAGLTTTWLLNLSGTAQVAIGNQPLPVQLTHGAARLETTVLPQANGPSHLSAMFSLTTLQGEIPLLGTLTPWRGILEKQVNQRLGQELPKTLVPTWWPTSTHWDLQVVPSAMGEY
jgi:hypothetical protein